MPNEFKEVFKKVASDYNIPISEVYLMWRGMWAAIDRQLSTNAPMREINIRGLGRLVPRKDWKDKVLASNSTKITKEERDEFIRT